MALSELLMVDCFSAAEAQDTAMLDVRLHFVSGHV